MHVHAMKTNPNFSSDMCPWFLSNMPGGDPKHGVPSFTNTDCIAPLKAAKNDAEMQAAIESRKRIKRDHGRKRRR